MSKQRLNVADDVRDWGDEIRALAHWDLEHGIHEQIADAVIGRIVALEAKLEAANKAIKEWRGVADSRECPCRIGAMDAAAKQEQESGRDVQAPQSKSQARRLRIQRR